MRDQLATSDGRRRIVDAVHRNDDGDGSCRRSRSVRARWPADVDLSANKRECDLNRQRQANTFRICTFLWMW